MCAGTCTYWPVQHAQHLLASALLLLLLLMVVVVVMLTSWLQHHLGLEVNAPSNMLLLVASAEKRFDGFQWTLKPLLPAWTEGVDGKPQKQQSFKVGMIVVH